MDGMSEETCADETRLFNTKSITQESMGAILREEAMLKCTYRSVKDTDKLACQSLTSVCSIVVCQTNSHRYHAESNTNDSARKTGLSGMAYIGQVDLTQNRQV